MAAAIKGMSAARLAEAKAVASALLDDIELGSVASDRILMKAQRLARVLADEDAQRWLELEVRGYPKGVSLSSLKSCAHYAGPRLQPENKYYNVSLPKLEALRTGAERSLESFRFPDHFAPSASSSSPHDHAGMNIASAVNRTVQVFQQELAKAKTEMATYAEIVAALRASVHAYAADCLNALAFGETAFSLFEQSRAEVDAFVRCVAPKAAEQIVAAFERYQSGDAEALSHALTSVRRLVCTVADSVFPARDELYEDRKKKKRKVGPEEYKNRLLAFIDGAVGSQTTATILETDIEHLAERLDAMHAKACKGVHDEVSEAEVRLVLMSAYSFLGEIARLDRPPRPGPATTPVAVGAQAEREQ